MRRAFIWTAAEQIGAIRDFQKGPHFQTDSP
jgi:hypothetical protein